MGQGMGVRGHHTPRPLGGPPCGLMSIDDQRNDVMSDE